MAPLPALLLACAAAASAQAPPADWRDQVVYFVLTDRFANGDRSNDDQGRGEFDPKNCDLFNGGDLSGLRGKLDYIQGLGATALWLTPPVANVWYDPALKMAGYHGYWAENFKAVDKHLGTLDDYRRLSSDLHDRGMRLIQDVVVNHTGDFFRYEGPYDPKRPERNFKLKPGMVPPRPSQFPFSMNDASSPGDRETGIYHWTPDIQDYADENQRLTWQMSGLDDLDTSRPEVRRALKNSYAFWIRAAGVDGLRIDTARFVEHDFYRDFIHCPSTQAPGVAVFAAGLGIKDFLTFGEVWVSPPPFTDGEEREAASYLGSPDAPEMSAALNFPLAFDLRAVFAKGAPPAQLAYRLGGLSRNFAGGSASVNFIDNHDMPRFLSEGDEAGLAQALAALFTLPGIPVIYMGTEQGLCGTRSSMFAGGCGSDGRDHFDEGRPLYRLIGELSRLRRDNPEFRRGTLQPLFAEPAGPGALAYRLGEALAVFNTAEEPVLLAGLETGLGEGRPLRELFSRGASTAALRTGPGGRLTLSLPPRSILVLKASGPAAPAAAPGGSVSIARVSSSEAEGSSSRTQAGGEVFLLVDGRLSRPIPAEPGRGGAWRASFDPASLSDGEHSLRAVLSSGSIVAVSEPRTLRVDVPFRLAASAEDPVGDARGPSGTYLYPLAPGFEGRADIRRLSLYARGSSVKLVVEMAHGISQAWKPLNGFDHVCLLVFITFPGGGKASDLPKMNARLPGGGGWDAAAFLGGWTAALYGAEGASASSFGPRLRPDPRVSADKEAGTIEAVFDLSAFPGAKSFDGARFYAASWDYDGVGGALRPLLEEPADYAFGGGKPSDPRVMDDAVLINGR
jgi:glycosidase